MGRTGHHLRRATVGALATAGALVAGACVPPLPDVPPSDLAFTEHVVADGLAGAAFVVAADVLGDDAPELVASSFGAGLAANGRVTVHRRTGGLGDWEATEVVGPDQGIRFPNDPTVDDLDGDGDADVIVPAGFFLCELTLSPCGSLQWYEQDGGSWVRHQVVAPGNPRFYHAARLTDVDGDGLRDIVTVSETADDARTEWFRGTADGDRFEPTPRVIGAGGGSLPVVHDVDGDGDEDLVSPQLFGGSGFVWFERTADPSPGQPAGAWTRHRAASPGAGFAIEHVENLYGDGVDRWVATNHEAWDGAGVFVLDPPADPTDPWAATKVSTGIRVATPEPGSLAPGVLGVGDVDGDGDLDLAVSGDGDPRVFWLRQGPGGTFETLVVDTDMGQAGGALVVDLDGDGANELVFSSYEQDEVVVYERP